LNEKESTQKIISVTWPSEISHRKIKSAYSKHNSRHSQVYCQH